MLNSEKKQTIIKLLVTCAVIGVLLLVGYLIMRALGWTNLTREELQAFISSTGAVAPLIYIGISFLQATIVPLPAAVTIVAGNYLFGAGWAFLYSYIGSLIGSVFAFALGKIVGRRFVNWIVGGKEKTEEWLKKLKGRENILLFFMFLFPFFPDDILCAIAGILPISWVGFFAMQIITRATSIGATLLFMSGEIIPFHGWGLIVLGIIAVIGIVAFIVCFKKAEQINKCCSDILQKICKWKLFSILGKKRTRDTEADFESNGKIENQEQE